MKMLMKVALNGTNENPYHKYGLTQNPFPQLANAEYQSGCLRVQSLGGDPIPNVEYIREKLEGMTEEFIDLCCSQFRKGEYVTFMVSFPER